MDKLLSIDIETDNKDPMKANLKVVGVASSPISAACYIYPDDREKIQELLLSPLPKLAHNIKYDYKVLQRHGFKINGELEDTQILTQMNTQLTPENYKLKNLVKELLGEDFPTFDDLMCKYHPNMKKTLWKFDNIPLKTVMEYCANDCKITYKLYNYLQDITEPCVMKVYKEIEKPLLKLVIDMEMRGITIDLQELERLKALWEREQRILQTIIYDYAGEEFNINPSYDLERILFSKLGYPILKYTEEGRPATGDEILQKMAWGGCILAEYIMDYRKVQKIFSTYLKPYQKMHINGKIHANFKQTGTETGRFSSSGPNLQNVPDDPRGVFVASRGNVLLSLDYKQIEVVVLAHYSKDPQLVEALLVGRDVHQETADKIKIIRDGAKEVVFGLAYRMGAWGLHNRFRQRGLRYTLKESQDFLLEYQTLHPGIENYATQMVNNVLERGYAETLTGRKRYLKPETDTKKAKHHFESQCVNTPIQGSAADIIKIAMLNCAKLGYTPVLQVHDELIFDIPISHKEKAKSEIKEVMEHAVKLDVPLRVDVKEGNSWKDL